MSIRTLISRSLLTGIFMTAAGTVFARQPPALDAARRATERQLACEGATAKPGAGYRDASVRFASSGRISSTQSAGYRDSVARFGATDIRMVACTTPSERPRASAQR